MPGNDHLIDFSARAWPAGWEVSGNAFGGGPTQTMNWTGMGFDTDTLDVWNMIAGFDGSRLLHSGLRPAEDYRCHADCRSMHPGCAIPEPVEEQTGRLLSPPFRIDKRFINLRIGGSYSPLHACVNLHVDEQVVRSSTGANTEYLRWQTWDVGSGAVARHESRSSTPTRVGISRSAESRRATRRAPSHRASSSSRRSWTACRTSGSFTMRIPTTGTGWSAPSTGNGSVSATARHRASTASRSARLGMASVGTRQEL